MGRGDVAEHDKFQALLRRHFTPAVASTLLPGIQRIRSLPGSPRIRIPLCAVLQ